VPQVKSQFQGTMPLPGAQPATPGAGVAQGPPSVLHDPTAVGGTALKPPAANTPAPISEIDRWKQLREAEKAQLVAETGGAAPAPLAGGPLAPGALPAAGAAGAPVAGVAPATPVAASPTPASVPLKSSTPEPANTSPKPVPVEPKLTTYTVANGDSLWKIAVKQYGDSNIQEHVDAIVAANPSVDASHLKVGTKLNLPPKQTSVNRLPAKEQAKLLDSGLYAVKKGDTLSSIAKKQLGDANRWREIYDLNREHIADPSMLFTGTQLRLPKS